MFQQAQDLRKSGPWSLSPCSNLCCSDLRRDKRCPLFILEENLGPANVAKSKINLFCIFFVIFWICVVISVVIFGICVSFFCHLGLGNAKKMQKTTKNDSQSRKCKKHMQKNDSQSAKFKQNAKDAQTTAKQMPNNAKSMTRVLAK